MTTNAYKNTLHVYTPNDKDFARKADSLATALYEAAEQKAYQELSREELFAFLEQAASLQDSHTGLLKLCIDDMMPADMQVDWLKKKSEEICGPDYESKFSPKPFDD